MHLIQSNTDDRSTNDVLDWIFYIGNKNKVCRINNETTIQNISFKISNASGVSIELSTSQGKITNEHAERFWYRRGHFSNTDFKFPLQDIKFKDLIFKIQNNFQKENERIIDMMYSTFEKKGRINGYRENFTNKIQNLSSANDSGLKIPETLVTNNIKDILDFSARHSSFITKDIEFNSIQFPFGEDSQVYIHQPVLRLSKSDIEEQDVEEFRHPSMYQQYIEKKYELRIFYLKGKFYTMAIFSQANERTKTDFRNYDAERPNRCVPYQLPQKIEEKLNHLMQGMNINCGSIDMIYTPEKEYVFLEVNPIGQFQWVSKSCNYDIERQIALDILKENI